MNKWRDPLSELQSFDRFVREMPPLPDAGEDVIVEYSSMVENIQDLLSMVGALPPDDRPPVVAWDDILGPLGRVLFRKGAEIDRYVLGRLWRPVLREAGELNRYIRATVSVGASARDFYLYDEASALCEEALVEAHGSLSAALPYLHNQKGVLLAIRGDYERARASFMDARRLSESFSDAELLKWGALDKKGFWGQERFNQLNSLLNEGYEAPAERLSAIIDEAGDLSTSLADLNLGEGFDLLLRQYTAELSILEENYDGAETLLGELYLSEKIEDPYRFSMKAVQSRLLSILYSRKGDNNNAYRWIRTALTQGLRHCYPAEEHFVLEQAVKVLKKLHGKAGEKGRNELIDEMVLLLEDKDWYTGRSHSRNVSELALKIGSDLRNREDMSINLEELRVAGLLHDIGKLKVPWSLLNKIAPITPRERVLLEKHSEHGQYLLAKMGMDNTAAIVEQHHEKLDGSGYPKGRPAGDLASIIAVCDVFEASITPNRRYKKPKSRQAALEEISSYAGRWYRPEVTRSLLRVAST